MLQFLGLQIQDPALSNVIDQYRPNMGSTAQKGTHFVKGKVGRYRKKLTSEQQQLCLDAFGDYLERMGYPVEVSDDDQA